MSFRKYPLILIALFLLFGIGSVRAGVDNKDVGTSVFNFLKIDVGARPMSMGGAFTGLADDENSLFYNPAGLGSVEGRRFMAGYHNNYFDMQSGFLGYIHPLDSTKRLGVQVNYLNYGDFIRTDDEGNENGTFGGSDILFAGSFAMTVKRNVQLGATVKYIYEKIDSYSSSGFAVDLGGKLIISRNRYSDSVQTSVGFMVQNLGTQLSKYVDGGESYSLPTVIRAGFAAVPKEIPVLIAADIVKPMDNDFYFAGGVEVNALYPLYLRMGYSSFGTNYKTETNGGDFAGLSAGFGIVYKEMQISYTISPQAELGTSHRVTFTGGIK